MSKRRSCICKYFPQGCNPLYGGVHGTFSPSFCKISFKYLTCRYYPVQVFIIKSNFSQLTFLYPFRGNLAVDDRRVRLKGLCHHRIQKTIWLFPKKILVCNQRHGIKTEQMPFFRELNNLTQLIINSQETEEY